jgi:hypothetical protein
MCGKICISFQMSVHFDQLHPLKFWHTSSALILYQFFRISWTLLNKNIYNLTNVCACFLLEMQALICSSHLSSVFYPEAGVRGSRMALLERDVLIWAPCTLTTFAFSGMLKNQLTARALIGRLRHQSCCTPNKLGSRGRASNQSMIAPRAAQINNVNTNPLRG